MARRRPNPGFDPTDESPTGAWVPYGNPPAVIAYGLSVVGLIPGLGLICGPLAVLFGLIGRQRVRRDPSVRGYGHSLLMGVGLGSFEFIVNAIGLYFIVKGWREL